METQQGYPIEDLIDFLDPSFPGRVDRRKGFGRSVSIPLDKKGAAEIQELLRRLIEEWIDSGFQANGSEEPSKRNFSPKPCRETWADDGEANLFPPPKAVTEMARLLGGTLLTRVSRDEPMVFQAGVNLQAGVDRRFSVTIGAKGGLDFSPTMTRHDDPGLIAAGLFLEFYRSEWLFLLMRCRNCGLFSVPDRKPRERYVRGWHCPKCSKAIPAVLSVQKSRAALRERWFTLAVQALQKWNAKPRRAGNTGRAVWIAEEVNKGLRRVDRISKNTITRNLSEIEECAKEKKHAES
jgi:hypothetical protein